MIVRQFLHWLRTAPSGHRAEATSALARAFLYSNLTENDRAAAEGAMIMLLDDPSPLVRRALAEVFAGCEDAPSTVVHALAGDQPMSPPRSCSARPSCSTPILSRRWAVANS